MIGGIQGLGYGGCVVSDEIAVDIQADGGAGLEYTDVMGPSLRVDGPVGFQGFVPDACVHDTEQDSISSVERQSVWLDRAFAYQSTQACSIIGSESSTSCPDGYSQPRREVECLFIIHGDKVIDAVEGIRTVLVSIPIRRWYGAVYIRVKVMATVVSGISDEWIVDDQSVDG